MIRLSLPGAFLLTTLSCGRGQVPTPIDPTALVQKIQGELGGPTPSPEGKDDPSIPHGEYMGGEINSTIYPGQSSGFQVYVPAQYDPAKPACLLVKLDGIGGYECAVLDHLIASKEIPIIIGVGISPGMVNQNHRARLPTTSQSATTARSCLTE